MIVMVALVHHLVTVIIALRKESMKTKNKLLKKILITVMGCVFILACYFEVLVIFCMCLFLYTGV